MTTVIPRVEYGARLVSAAANVYVKAFDRAVVDAWIAEYGPVAAAQVVTRIWTGETHTGWAAA